MDFILLQLLYSKVVLKDNLAHEFYYDIKASFTILFTVFVWIFYYTMFGFYLFRYTFEGAQNFVDFKTSYSSMFTALTTANFPDVALPAMQ